MSVILVQVSIYSVYLYQVYPHSWNILGSYLVHTWYVVGTSLYANIESIFIANKNRYFKNDYNKNELELVVQGRFPFRICVQGLASHGVGPIVEV